MLFKHGNYDDEVYKINFIITAFCTFYVNFLNILIVEKLLATQSTYLHFFLYLLFMLGIGFLNVSKSSWGILYNLYLFLR